MAKLPNSRVILRFGFGTGAYKARQRYENASTYIARNVAFTYAEEAYVQMRTQLQQRIEMDVRAELVHLTKLFRQHIVGAAGSRNTPSGNLDTVAKGAAAPTVSLASMLPPWAPRNTQYLRRKRNAIGHVDWFNNKGWKSGGYDRRFARRVAKSGRWPVDPGLLFSEMNSSTSTSGGQIRGGDIWETMFGPISVKFFRKGNQEGVGQALVNTGGRGDHIRVVIGRIEVRALGKVTPHMLPGMTRSGGTVRATSQFNKELIGLVAGYNEAMAYRLGRMRNGVYRPTLEPFLGFFLTKALPHAVNERLRKGGFGSIQRRA